MLGMVVDRAAATIAGSLGLLTLAFGVRLALGATPGDIRRLITKQGMIWAGMGLMLGLLAGSVARRGLRRVVRGVAVTDPLALILTPLALAGSADLACYFPARRASRLNPLIGLRED